MPEELDARRKRLRFRAWHRGTRELDLIIGSFADRHLADLPDDALDGLEALLEEADTDVFGWIAGRAAPPAEHAALVARLREIELKPENFG